VLRKGKKEKDFDFEPITTKITLSHAIFYVIALCESWRQFHQHCTSTSASADFFPGEDILFGFKMLKNILFWPAKGVQVPPLALPADSHLRATYLLLLFFLTEGPFKWYVTFQSHVIIFCCFKPSLGIKNTCLINQLGFKRLFRSNLFTFESVLS